MRSSTPTAVSGELSAIGALHRSPRSAEWLTTMPPPPFSRQAKYKRSRNELLDVSAARADRRNDGGGPHASLTNSGTENVCPPSVDRTIHALRRSKVPSRSTRSVG